MKGLHWWTLLVGYLVGSFFGVSVLLGFFAGLGKAKTQPAAAA